MRPADVLPPARDRVLLSATLAVILLTWAAVAFACWRGRQDAIDDWRYFLANLSEMAAQHADQTLAAADAVLKHLKQNGQELQDRLNARTTRHADELNTFCTEFGAPIRIVHFASVWKVNFLEDHPLQDLLFAMMRSRGIHILDNFPCFFTTAHSEADFAAIAKAFRDSVLELQEAEFLPRRQRASVHAIDADKPPVHGARLGKDAEGNPAWFVPNPDAPGKFMRISA